jgi:hypothetical protein
MTLSEAIEAYNEAHVQKIQLRPTRDGRVGAILPLTGRQVLVVGSQFKEEVKVGPADIALICMEVRRSMEPALALLDAALGMLDERTAKEKPE